MSKKRTGAGLRRGALSLAALLLSLLLVLVKLKLRLELNTARAAEHRVELPHVPAHTVLALQHFATKLTGNEGMVVVRVVRLLVVSL